MLPEYPASYIERTLTDLIEAAESAAGMDSAVDTWNSVHERFERPTPFATSARKFQNMLDTWEKAAASYTPVIQEGVNSATAELHQMLFDLNRLNNNTLLRKCKELRLIVRMGNVTVDPDFDWPQEDRREILAKISQLKKDVLASHLEELHKRNIVDALEDVLRAIDAYPEAGSNRITDALYKAFALLRAVAPVLNAAGIIIEIPERIQHMLPE